MNRRHFSFVRCTVAWLILLLLGAVSNPCKAQEDRAVFEKSLDALHTERVKSLSTATTNELREALQNAFPQDLKLSDILQSPAYEATRGKMQDIYEVDLATLKKDGRIPPATRVEYLRRFAAFGRLIEKKDDSLWNWFIGRKDAQPTLLDAFIVLRSGEEMPHPNKLPHDQWSLLLNATNPMCRALAVIHIDECAKPQEVTEALARAVNDQYYYIRLRALDAFQRLTPDGTKEVIEKFLKRELPKDLTQEHLDKENLLNATAREILQKLQAP